MSIVNPDFRPITLLTSGIRHTREVAPNYRVRKLKSKSLYHSKTGLPVGTAGSRLQRRIESEVGVQWEGESN